jgi:CRISPR-associated protein Cmr6
MNPHYSDYYSNAGAVPPADYLSPVPVNFLTVRNADFLCYVGYSPLADTTESESETLIKAAAWLKAALTKHGVGAKTSVGYGFFEEKEVAAQ